MALDEAHALVQSLLADEMEPDRRARLVALQLALGWPHALEVTPEQLAELRVDQGRVRYARAQAWLGALSVLAFVWCAPGVVLWGFLGGFENTLLTIGSGFFLGFIQACVGIAYGFSREPPATRTPLFVLAWSGVLGPGYALMAAGFYPDAFFLALLFATPSMLVAVAAAFVARHTRPV